MSDAASFPGDRQLLAQAARRLRDREGAPLVFGGLGRRVVAVTISAGATTSSLTSLVIRPERGLGGKVLLSRRLTAVPRYEGSQEITHDYDGPVLAEGVIGLAAAPLMSGDGVRGLLYVGTREGGALTPSVLRGLAAEAEAISRELWIREEVDRRVRALSGGRPAVPYEHRRRLREIAATTGDPETRRALVELLETADAPGDRLLTPRQRQVLELVELGLRNAEIGALLGLSEQTVKAYMRALMERLGARSRQEAVHLYHRSVLGA